MPKSKAEMMRERRKLLSDNGLKAYMVYLPPKEAKNLKRYVERKGGQAPIKLPD